MSPLDPRIPLGVQPVQIQSPLETMSAIAQFQDVREQSEARRLAAEEARTKRTRQQQIDAALEQAFVVDPATGRPRLDPSRLVGHLPASLMHTVMQELDADAKTAQELQAGRLDFEAKKRAHLGSAAQTIRAAGYDPQLFGIEIRAAQRLGAIDDAAAARLLAIEDPAQIQALTDAYIAQAGGKAAETGFTLSPGQVRYGPRGEVLATGPAAAAGADSFTLSPGSVRFSPTGEQLAAVPPTPPAPRDERIVSVIGPDGKPVYVRESQALGQTPGTTAAGGATLSAGAQEDIATMLTVQDLGTSVIALGDRIKWRGTGPIAGWVGPTGARFGMGGADAEELRNKLGNIQATIAKLRGGTSFTPNEQALLDRYTPTPTDSVLQIKAKLKSLDEFITAKRENTLRVAGGQYTPRGPAGTPTPTGGRGGAPGPNPFAKGR